ncbi:MAG TPA: hypothetical protein VK904_04155, partial [Miltoncostaeaceae bacterium]|nr:hypothetical protein [Miltoncostaeaceae bacterium]
QGSGGWRLVLRNPDTTVTTFTDRPVRVGGAARLARLVAGWGRTFAGDPPNAALQLDRAPPGRDVVLLELRRPRYDRRERTLTFRVSPLKTTQRRLLSALARRADRRVAASFGRASLFVDDGPSAIGYQVTVNLLGGVPSGAPVAFSLSLTNSQFRQIGQLEPTFGFGRTVTPSMTVDFSAQQLALTVPSGSRALANVAIDSPASGRTVLGSVTLPCGYTLIVSSEAGQVETLQSGPISIPAPPPPG